MSIVVKLVTENGVHSPIIVSQAKRVVELHRPSAVANLPSQCATTLYVNI